MLDHTLHILDVLQPFRRLSTDAASRTMRSIRETVAQVTIAWYVGAEATNSEQIPFTSKATSEALTSWVLLCIRFFIFYYCIFTIYSRYIKRVISKRDRCEYLKQVPFINGSLELI
jgi:hypothetical protein